MWNREGELQVVIASKNLGLLALGTLKYESHVKRMEGLIATRNSQLCFEGIRTCKRTSLKEPSALLGRYG